MELIKKAKALHVNYAYLLGWFMLVVMNYIDYVSTKEFLAMGGREANPVAAFLFQQDLLLISKMTLLTALFVVVLVSRVNIFVAIIFWFTVTMYAVVTFLHIIVPL